MGRMRRAVSGDGARLSAKPRVCQSALGRATLLADMAGAGPSAHSRLLPSAWRGTCPPTKTQLVSPVWLGVPRDHAWVLAWEQR